LNPLSQKFTAISKARILAGGNPLPGNIALSDHDPLRESSRKASAKKHGLAEKAAKLLV